MSDVTTIFDDTDIFDTYIKDRQFSTIGEFKAAWGYFEAHCKGKYKTTDSKRYPAEDERLSQLEYKHLQYGCRAVTKKK